MRRSLQRRSPMASSAFSRPKRPSPLAVRRRPRFLRSTGKGSAANWTQCAPGPAPSIPGAHGSDEAVVHRRQHDVNGIIRRRRFGRPARLQNIWRRPRWRRAPRRRATPSRDSRTRGNPHDVMRRRAIRAVVAGPIEGRGLSRLARPPFHEVVQHQGAGHHERAQRNPTRYCKHRRTSLVARTHGAPGTLTLKDAASTRGRGPDAPAWE
jgi:hypothetical protein